MNIVLDVGRKLNYMSTKQIVYKKSICKCSEISVLACDKNCSIYNCYYKTLKQFRFKG